MDKDIRLRHYSEKDYTEVIDFPVELVGRDGVVRKYSYADSIRIYERRIESAHIRYSDREIINAEISHCSKRLDQIKRSWRERIRFFEQQFIEDRPGLKDRELYERGKRFLRKYVSRVSQWRIEREALQDPNLVILDEGRDLQVFFVNWNIFYSGTLLYVYRLNGAEGDRLRSQHQSFVALLRQMAQAPDTEKLVHQELESEVAFVLTSPRADPLVRHRRVLQPMVVQVVEVEGGGGAVEEAKPMAWVEGLLDSADSADDGPYRQGLDELRWNNFESAFGQFKLALRENPYHKEAYWALAELTALLGNWDDSEHYLLMAIKYFKDEPKAYLYHGIYLLKRKRLSEAEAAFDHAVSLNLGQSRGYGYLSCAQALQSHFSSALRTLERGLEAFPNERGLVSLEAIVRSGLLWRRYLRWIVLLLLSSVIGLVGWLGSATSWLGGAVCATLFCLIYLHRMRQVRTKLWEWSTPTPE